MDIFLSTLRMNWKMSTVAICEHICRLNEHKLSAEQVEKLVSVAPTRKQAADFSESLRNLSRSDMLGKAALFWRELLEVDARIRDRMQLWLFKLGFAAALAEERAKSEVLHAAAKQARADDDLKRVLSLALDIGNYVNGGKRQGRAYGFGLATLEKLDQFPRRRNDDGSAVPTLLEYMWTLLADKHKSWPSKLAVLDEAVAVDVGAMNAKLRRLEQSMDLLYERLQSADATRLADKQLVQRMQPFYADASQQLTALNASISASNEQLAALARWFGVDDAQSDGDRLAFLKQLNAFRKSFDGIGARLELRKQQKLRKERRAKGQQQRGRRKKKKGAPPPVRGGVQMPGFGRRESIMRAVAAKQPLKLDVSGNLMPQMARGGAARSASRSISRAGMRQELWKFAASVDNKVKV